MQFGVHLPHIGPQANRENLIRVAQEADELGFDSCWVSDHIAWPQSIHSRYPYNETGEFPAASNQIPWLDSIATLLFVAGCTENVHLGTTVMILGYRPALQTAKLWATLDNVSNGRAILGVGIGWMREEFEALGMPFDHRGARADEMLEIYRTLFSEAQPSFTGRFYKFDAVGFEPKPVRGQIPVWVGGHSAAAYRRVARYGDVFHAAFSTPALLVEQWRGVQAACEKEGRDPASVGLSVRMRLRLDSQREDEGALRGSPDQIVDQIGRFAEMGVSHITMDIAAGGGAVDAQVEVMQRFASDVRPSVG